MSFIRSDADLKPIVDTVFSVAAKARQDLSPETVNATIGTLYGEDGKLVALRSVFDHYDALDQRVKASYAVSFDGNPTYRKAVWDWLTQGTGLDLPHCVIATPGGTGAISMALGTFLARGESVILPDIAWGTYRLMAGEMGLKVVSYSLFSGDAFDLGSVAECLEEVMERQGRVVMVINDPCHNPTGYSLTTGEWEKLVELLNRTARKGPVVLIDDVAYLDYANDLAHCRDYMKLWEKLSGNVLVTVAFSCSKSLTSYGLRCGAAVVIGQDAQAVRQAEIVMEKAARATWSNTANAAMENFTWVVTENRTAFLEEKQQYIDLIQKRSQLLISEAEQCGLKLYPYQEGFFVTVTMPDNARRDNVHAELMARHIYTVAVNRGIRLAVCSLPLAKVAGLAEKVMRASEAC